MGSRIMPDSQGCVIDTNILIYHLHSALDKNAERLLKTVLERGSYISVITRIELLGWHKHTSKSIRLTESLLEFLEESPLTSEVVDICVALRRKNNIKIPDAVIAATAIHLKKPPVGACVFGVLGY